MSAVLSIGPVGWKRIRRLNADVLIVLESGIDA